MNDCHLDVSPVTILNLIFLVCFFFVFFFSNLSATPTPAIMVSHDRVQYRKKESTGINL